MNTSPSGGTTPSTDQTLGHILDTLFGAGLTRGELYERGKPGGTITSDALHKAKTAIQALLTQERNKAIEDWCASLFKENPEAKAKVEALIALEEEQE